MTQTKFITSHAVSLHCTFSLAGYFFLKPLLLSADVFKINLFQITLSGTLSQFGSRVGCVSPDLDVKCLQRLSADDKSRC